MVTNYAALAFSAASRRLQQQHGSRAAYARVEARSADTVLTRQETVFIARRDGFYLASIGTNGFPYVQFRGGPAGFLRVLDAHTLAFLDFGGNRQYISVGNLETNPNVALFLMDYPNQTRLKLYATARVMALDEQPDLTEQLLLPGYGARPERIIHLSVEAFNWNCPQHIPQRFTVDELSGLVEPYQTYIRQLEGRIAELGGTTDDLRPH
jgi:hypothetical protein